MSIRDQILGRLNLVKSVAGDADLRCDIASIPKYELHVHLGGSIRRATAVDLARKNCVALPAPEKDFLCAATPLEFFEGSQMWELFHTCYKWHWSCVKSCEDLERIVIEFLEDSHGQGICHSEFTVSGSYLMRAFPFDDWTAAIASGIEAANRRFGVDAAAILDISRRFGSQDAIRTVELLIDKRPKCLCGIGMGGDEVKYPHHLFREVFKLARECGISTTVHTSEFTQAETTIEAIEELRPNRLGHALNAVKSPQVYAALRRSGIHVESCPTCNYVCAVGGLDSISQHPIERLYRDGIPVSINTDDPQIFGYDLIDTYVCLIKESGLCIEDLKAINAQSSDFTFF